MKKELDEALCRDFPLTFKDRHASMHVTCMCWGFPGDGWEPLIRKTAEKIEAILVAMPENEREHSTSSQVKEKFGTLRWYFGGETDEIDKLISAAEDESCKTCEECGTTENVTTKGGWVTTLCNGCRDSRDKAK